MKKYRLGSDQTDEWTRRIEQKRFALLSECEKTYAEIMEIKPGGCFMHVGDDIAKIYAGG